MTLSSFAIIAATSLAACGGGESIGPVGSPSTANPGTPSPSPTLAPGATATPTSRPSATATPLPTPTPVVDNNPTPTGSARPAGTALPTGEKIYVVNHGQLGDNPTVTIYPAAATGAATPIASIAGSQTMIAQPWFDAVDSTGTLYVSNQSNTPGTQTAGYVTEYAANDQSGNVAPTRTITGLHNPEGVAIDSAGNLYVAVVDAVDVFAPGASGNAEPTRVIGGTSTTLQNLFLGGQPAGVALDSTNDIYVAMGPVVLEFAAGATGNVAPINVFGGANGSNPATTGPPYGSATLASCLGVAVDATAELYCANFNNSSFAFFASPSAPGVTVESTGASMPLGIAIDATGEVFVANYKGSSVQVFSSMTTFVTGVATATISGAGTNLNFPYGVTAR